MMFGFSLSHQSNADENQVTCQVLTANGGRLKDQNAVEDYHANAVMSHKHQMAFVLRRPARMYRHLRNGLAPMKDRSVYIYNRTQRPIGHSLPAMIQLESLFLAQMSGVDGAEDPEARTARALRVVEVAGAILLPIVGLVIKAWVLPGDDGATALLGVVMRT